MHLNLDSRAHARRVTPAILLLLATTTSAEAAAVFTRVDLLGLNCPRGDATCGSATSFTPGAGFTANSLANVGAGTTVHSALGYIDPLLGTTNSSNGAATAGAGFLQVMADAAVSSTPPLGQSGVSLQSLTAIAEGRFTDQLTIDAPTAALQGSFARVNASLVVEGQLGTSAVNVNAGGGLIANANWRIAYQVADAFGGSVSTFNSGFFGAQAVTAFGTFPQGPALPATIPISFNIRFGVPFDVQISAAVVALATMSSGTAKPLTEGISAASAAAQFGNTFFWNGIASVTSGGQTVSDFTVTSTSGADYASALRPSVVPLPATAWLLLSGVAALARRRQRGGRRAR